jgi:hypothetical protein
LLARKQHFTWTVLQYIEFVPWLDSGFLSNFEIMIKKKQLRILLQSQSPLYPMEALWYENHENPRDRKSLTWVP